MSTVPDLPEGVALEGEQSRFQQYRGPMAIVVMFIGAGTALFSLLYVSGGLPSLGMYFHTIQYNAIFMSGILTLALLLYPARRGVKVKRSRPPWYDILLILASLAGTLYIIVNAFEIDSMGRLLAKPIETLLGIMTIIVLLEVVRRTVGWPMVIISLAFVLYAKLSYFFPGILSAHLQTWPRIIAELYLSPSGMFGNIVTLASSIIVAFIGFGAFFNKVMGGKVLLDLGLSLTGQIRGGPAKAAIVSSALFGMVSGSPTANVAITGTVTIPLMKRMGYHPVFAGAVETVASTGGIIMPPIMGATAFIMADLLKVSYVTVALAATIPALLYFIALYVQTDLRAVKENLQGIPKGELPSFKATLKGGWEFSIPIFFLIIALFALRYPPAVAASYTIGVLILTTLFKKRTRLSWRGFIEALADLSEGMLMVAPIIAASGIIMGTVAMTGVGPKLAKSLVAIAGGNTLALFFLAAVACYALGMGVNIIITYILLALLVAPALTSGGVPEMVSHFFIFYMGVSMFITPPYAPAAFVASAISGASPYRTGFQAMRLGIVTFIVPFMLIYNPALLLIGSPIEVAVAAMTAIIGVIALSAGVEGYLFTNCNWLQRILALGGGLSLMAPGWETDIVGVVALSVVILWQWRWQR